MSYTVSHRQAGVTRGDTSGLVRHEFRDVDKYNGIETQHSNERIVPERTHMNHSVLFVDGQPQPLQSSEHVLQELDHRLDSVAGTYTDKRTGEVRKRKIRSDAKVVRSVVLQLDPDWTRSCEHLLAQAETGDTEAKQQVEAMTWRMVDRYGQKYGRQNLLAASFHWDETSPHIHLMITPIDDEGRVRNQSFIPDGRGPQSAMAMNDREMRQFLILKGYDADPQPIGDARSHMHQDDYARWREEQEQHKAREVELADREMRLGKREKVAEQRERMVDEYESEVGERDDEAQRLAEESARQNEIARRAVEEAEAREREMTEALEKHRAARQWYLAAGQSMKRAVDAANALWREAQKAGFRPTTDKEFKDAVREVSQLYGRSKSPDFKPEGPTR